MSASSFRLAGARLHFNNVLVVIKQTAFEEYNQVSLVPELLPLVDV
jgi:hypothetical protein